MFSLEENCPPLFLECSAGGVLAEVEDVFNNADTCVARRIPGLAQQKEVSSGAGLEPSPLPPSPVAPENHPLRSHSSLKTSSGNGSDPLFLYSIKVGQRKLMGLSPLPEDPNICNWLDPAG